MIINVKNRWEAERSSDKLPDRTAIISIRDPIQPRPEFAKDKNLIDVLRLSFSDVPEGETDCMNVFHAKSIGQFLMKNATHIDRLIVHCTFGQHRSAAVAAAILKALSNDEVLLHHDYLDPNRWCYSLTLAELSRLKEEGNLPDIECKFEE